MDAIHLHFGKRPVWAKYGEAISSKIHVTEIWRRDVSSSIVAAHKVVMKTELESWLDEPRRTTISTTESRTRILRLLWIGASAKFQYFSGIVSPSASDVQTVLRAWHLQDAYDYAQSCYAGVSALPARHDDGAARSFTITYHPKLALGWSHAARGNDGGDGVPETLCVVFSEGDERKAFMEILTGTPWSADLVAHPMFPALASGLLLSGEFDVAVGDIKGEVRVVEARTGHHRFRQRRQEEAAAGELGQLSARMSGCAAKLANGTRKLRVVEAILAFALEHADCGAATAIRTKGDVEGDSGSAPTYTATESTYDDPAWPRELEGRGSASVVDTDADAAQRILAHHVRLVQHRVRMQAVDNEYVQQRIQVQIAALSHLIAQQDNAMAFETADATRLLSESSRRDSSSMKMLALVAMFFLPGSFVAALFSTPLFDWDAASSGIGLATRPQFGLFWAITVPLTAATFALYFAGLLSQRREHNRREKMATAPVVATSLKSQNTDMGRFE